MVSQQGLKLSDNKQQYTDHININSNMFMTIRICICGCISHHIFIILSALLQQIMFMTGTCDT
jgi:hypothetical protein